MRHVAAEADAAGDDGADTVCLLPASSLSSPPSSSSSSAALRCSSMTAHHESESGSTRNSAHRCTGSICAAHSRMCGSTVDGSSAGAEVSVGAIDSSERNWRSDEKRRRTIAASCACGSSAVSAANECSDMPSATSMTMLADGRADVEAAAVSAAAAGVVGRESEESESAVVGVTGRGDLDAGRGTIPTTS